ncbi:DUF4249 family protein [Dyadobacter sp. SG02]|uniref:DUF4249 family protein n=1 Tax=Dyadobacter sp. SG02 TaxID=1855291 RepID=UPI0015A5EC99|nr:DUF4249 family protein [Dyadobacter sp. SG02]
MICALMICGCNTGVQVEDIPPERLLAISSFVSPQDSMISVYVYKGQKVGSVIKSDSARISDAVVIVSNGSKEINLLYNDSTKRYEAENVFRNSEPGTILSLKVTAPEQLTASATAVIPPKPNAVSVQGARVGKDYLFSVIWENSSSYKFYNVWAEVEGEIRSSIGIFPLITSIDIPDNSFYFPSDKQASGRNSETGIVNSAYDATSERVVLAVTVANVDDTFFKFYKSFREYQTWLDNTSDNLPNFKESVPIYSNIINGTGYFAAYNSSKEIVYIK